MLPKIINILKRGEIVSEIELEVSMDFVGKCLIDKNLRHKKGDIRDKLLGYQI